MGKSKLNKDSPQRLEYTNSLLLIEVLGGIRLAGLDRLRCTLKIAQRSKGKTTSHPPLRHNLDLYNDHQVEKLIRKAAERLELGTSVLTASLAELTDELEAYRLEQIEAQQPQRPQAPILSAQAHKAAMGFLQASDLLKRTNQLIGQSGLIGEENNRLLMYLIFSSRKQSQPLHIVSLGSSGSGKTHLQEKVGALIPAEDKIEITTLSENAFYYFGQRELQHQLILIEDLDGAENALYPLRELQSKKRISKTIAHKNSQGDTRAMHLVVEGPVSVAGCTTREQIYEDNANRSFLIYVDESEAQDQRVMNYQRQGSAGKVNESEEAAAAQLLRNAQRLLKPIKVVNPYAEYLQLPAAVFKPRRSNQHYLQFIEVVTYYHQYQRPQQSDENTGELYIETSLEDIAQANGLLKEVLLRKSDELTGACRNYFERLKSYLKATEQSQFTNRMIRQALRVNASNQKRYNLSLMSNYYIKKVKGKKGSSYSYEVVSYEEYETLSQQVNDVLDQHLKQLAKRFSGSVVVHSTNEPLKAKKTK